MTTATGGQTAERGDVCDKYRWVRKAAIIQCVYFILRKNKIEITLFVFSCERVSVSSTAETEILTFSYKTANNMT